LTPVLADQGVPDIGHHIGIGVINNYCDLDIFIVVFRLFFVFVFIFFFVVRLLHAAQSP
jgi:hypothetical protein